MQKTNRVLLLSAMTLLSIQNLSATNWFTSAYNSLFSTQTSTTQYTLSENEARDYIAQSIASLNRALQSHMSSTELYNLKNSIEYTIRNAQYAYQNNYSFISAGKRYKKDIIDQFLSSAVLEYIEKTSYSYAYARTYNRDIAIRISASMRNNALALIAQNSTINYERLTPFVGYALERAINDKINRQEYDYVPVRPSAPPAPVKPTAPSYQSQRPSAQPAERLHTSEECCVCLEDFGGDIQRIYLKPCGHDMCKKCAFDWFFGATQKTTCPQCRSSVDLNKLQNDIA